MMLEGVVKVYGYVAFTIKKVIKSSEYLKYTTDIGNVIIKSEIMTEEVVNSMADT